MYDLVIRDGLVVIDEKAERNTIAVNQGKIAEIVDNNSIEGKQSIDAYGKIVMPGAIDTHTHFFEPGAEYREGFKHGSMAAASGGYTTIMEMPNSTPPVYDEETLMLKQRIAKKESCVDYMLWGASIPGKFHEIKRLKDLGVQAFKAFTLNAGPDFIWSDTISLYEGMREVASAGCIFGVHAEDESIINALRLKNEHETWTPALHEKSRPYYSELVAIAKALTVAKVTGCKLHICHVSIPEAIELIKIARANGVDVTVETCPHYLVLNLDLIEDKGTYSMICPPIRDKHRMERMWDYIADGSIDYIGTDHAPYTEEDKMPADGNLWNAAAGAPSIDIAVPLLLTEGITKRGITLNRMADLFSRNASKRFGLYPQKGDILVGSDADLMIIAEESWNYTRKDSLSKTKVNKFPYENKKLDYKVETTILRGEIVYSNGVIYQEPGFGKCLKK